MTSHSLGQMRRGRLLFSKSLWQLNRQLWKMLSEQKAAQATRGTTGATIPKSSGDNGHRGGHIRENRTGEQRQFRQTLTAGGMKDELAHSPQHLFSGQRRLFHWPAVAVELPHRFGRQLERTGQDPRLFVPGVKDSHNRHCIIIGAGLAHSPHQIMPNVSFKYGVITGFPRSFSVWRCGWQPLFFPPSR